MWRCTSPSAPGADTRCTLPGRMTTRPVPPENSIRPSLAWLYIPVVVHRISRIGALPRRSPLVAGYGVIVPPTWPASTGDSGGGEDDPTSTVLSVRSIPGGGGPEPI